MDDEAIKANDYKMHFMAVASRASSTHVMYRRDLPALLNFAMKINETELALDLGEFVLFVVFLINLLWLVSYTLVVCS